MTPTPQTNIRLSPAIKDQATAAAKGRGVSLARLVEMALEAYLGAVPPDTGLRVPPDTWLHRIEALENRVAALEGGTAPVSPASPTVTDEGFSQAEALRAAGYPDNPANASRDLGRKGSSPKAWLEGQGWRQEGRRWFPSR